jgi:hypothetical protein
VRAIMDEVPQQEGISRQGRVGDESGPEATVLGYPFRSKEKPV